MTELSKDHCEACTPGTPPLSPDQAEQLTSDVPDWVRNSNLTLRRSFSFKNFRETFGFISRVSLLAEQEGHHPDFEFGWGTATLTLTTHAAKGLTRNDFIMAAKVDKLLNQ